MGDNRDGRSGARFFDDSKRDLGWASQVTRRPPVVSTLTVFDVAGAEPALARSLALLDRRRLRIQCDDADYTFRWASGYGNGPDLRVQGVLEPK
jgi:hypothetical protein